MPTSSKRPNTARPTRVADGRGAPGHAGGWMRVFDWRHGQAAILLVGSILVVIATLYGIAEEAHEEQMMMESSTAPFRNAVEREFAKYGAMQSVAALTMDPLVNASGTGIRTYLMGDALERLYPAVKFVAFVRVVAREDLAEYERSSGLTLGFDESGVPAWSKRPKDSASRTHYYFLENVTPTSPRGIAVGSEIGGNPGFARDFERVAQRGALLTLPADSAAIPGMPGTVVLFRVEMPSQAAPVSARKARHGPNGAPTAAPASQPYGLLVAGIDFPRLMRDALRDLPLTWRVRLSLLPEGGGADVPGGTLYDSEVVSGVYRPGWLEQGMTMQPFEFEAWGSRLRLEINGYETHDYLHYDLIPWAAFALSLLLVAGVHFGYLRIRNVRIRARSLVQEVRTSTERFRDIVETSSDWIWELDDQLRFSYLSPTTETLLGYKPDDLLGSHAALLLVNRGKDPGDMPREFVPTPAAAASGLFPDGEAGIAPYTGFERRLRHKDGSEIIVESAGTPIVDDAGHVTGYRGIDRDVTQQRQFRQRLSQLHEDLARHMQTNLAGQLLSGLAHELNQPLSAILTYNQACLRLLKSGHADPVDISAAMQSTADNVLHARDILQRLRRFTARREPRAVPTPLAPLVQNCLGLIEIRLRSLEVETRIDIPASLPPVLADPILAAQVFLNVFNNAIDAMRDSALRRITVRASLVTGRNVQVRIEDSGPGIAPEHMARLFDAYFTTKPEGTGIGLPLCRSIIEAMGGSIKVSSEPGHGAVVDLEFPVAPRDQAGDAAGGDEAVADRPGEH